MSLRPGWYPQDEGGERFWDGTEWTDAVRSTTALQQEPAVPASPSKRATWLTNKGWELRALLVVGALAGAMFLLSQCLGGSNGNGSGGPDKYDTQATCKELVRKSMKNPSTADFSDEQQDTSTASGTVVAENALGGKVTFAYSCTQSGGTVELQSLTPR